MTTTFAVRGAPWERLARLREVIDLVADLRELEKPFASVEEFRKLVGLVVRLGALLGVDAAWLQRWESVLADDDLVVAVLAVVRYVLSIVGPQYAARTAIDAAADAKVTVDRRSYAEWLPLVVELLRLVLRLRGER